MTDQKRNRSNLNRSQASLQDFGPATGAGRDRLEAADDCGLDRERRNVGGPREGDQFETDFDDPNDDTRNTDEKHEGTRGFGRSDR